MKATELGSLVIKALLEKTGIDGSLIDEVIMGNVLPAGLGQAPARQAALRAGLPNKVECLTVNKVCGSSLKAVMLAQQAIIAGDAELVIAGGMESMSNAPHLLMNSRSGYRLGDQKIIDSMINDGLWDVYNNIHMGNCAESCARDFNFTREQVDEYAKLSYKRALNAQSNHKFDNEIIKVLIIRKGNHLSIDTDEEPSRVKFDKIPELKPAFDKNGIITAANASKINDGAAAVLVMSEEKALELKLKPLVEITAQASASRLPIEFTTAPADAVKKVLSKAKLDIAEIDLFEINEAFAVVSLAINKLLGLPVEKVNVNGGAIAIGHPIGASGARILVTLIHEMIRQESNYGLASLCIGGGEASAIIIKRYR